MDFSGTLVAWILLLEFWVQEDHKISGDSHLLLHQWKRSYSNISIKTYDIIKNNHHKLFKNLTDHYNKMDNPKILGRRRIENVIHGKNSKSRGIITSSKLILDEFSASTIDHITGKHPRTTCNVSLNRDKLIAKSCSGKFTILTLSGLERVKCTDLETLDVAGPTLIWNKNCHQQVEISYVGEYTKINKEIDRPELTKIEEEMARAEHVIILIFFIFLLFLSLRMINLYRFIRKLKTESDNYVTKEGLIFKRYLTFDASIGEEISLEAPNDNRPFEVKTTKISWIMLMVYALFFIPASVKSYSLVDYREIDGTNHIYTYLMDSSETIYTNLGEIKLIDSPELAPLYFNFYSYNWNIQTYSRSHCLRSGCESLMKCQEDTLPFIKASTDIKKELGITEGLISYATCKNMKAYCNFANGCFFIGFSLILKPSERFKIHTIGRTSKMNDLVELPESCFNPIVQKSQLKVFDDMLFVVKETGESWFCDNKLYSYYPLPNMLGDLQIDQPGNWRFQGPKGKFTEHLPTEHDDPMEDQNNGEQAKGEGSGAIPAIPEPPPVRQSSPKPQTEEAVVVEELLLESEEGACLASLDNLAIGETVMEEAGMLSDDGLPSSPIL